MLFSSHKHYPIGVSWLREGMSVARMHRTLKQILALDPERDNHRIVYLTGFYEFPYDYTRATEFALFRTFAVPSISRLLDQTGEFYQRAQKRYDDTDLILSEISENGYDSERGRAALRRMNQIHGRFRDQISNDYNLYVLSTFIYEPIRWITRFGWRPLVDQERLALYDHCREVGRRMGIKDIPESTEAYEQFNIAYEREHFRFTETNHRVGMATRDLFLGWYLPKPLWNLGAPAIYAFMDPQLLDAFGFPHPSPAIRALVAGSLRLRLQVVRRLPERRKPALRTPRKRRQSYPHGYTIEQLGPAGTMPAVRRRKWRSSPNLTEKYRGIPDARQHAAAYGEKRRAARR